MSEFEGHTPGPWSFCQCGSTKCGAIFGDSGNVHLGWLWSESQLQSGSDCPDPCPTDEAAKANAHLIAAAPALLSRALAAEAERDRLREALEKIARGPVMPPPDPVAHSWQAWGRFWHEQVDRLRILARAARTEPSHD